MNIAFRADASTIIGSGHIMRCLSLALYLRNCGCRCIFVCRAFENNLNKYIVDQGFETIALGKPTENVDRNDHSTWLGISEDDDVLEFIKTSSNISFDWVIIDHYGISARWESVVRQLAKKVAVIDDLANRKHDCDLLVDQNLGRSPDSYDELVDQHSIKLIGPKYALLRDEFSSLRAKALKKRSAYKGEDLNILISYGGADLHNLTTKTIECLINYNLSKFINKLLIVVGPQFYYEAELKRALEKNYLDYELIVNADNMAQIMTLADVCIGSAGSSSWERCCLGLPSICIIAAKNQTLIAENIEKHSAGFKLTKNKINLDLIKNLYKIFNKNTYQDIVKASSRICDGQGVTRVGDLLL